MRDTEGPLTCPEAAKAAECKSPLGFRALLASLS